MSVQSSLPGSVQPRDRDRSVWGEAGQFKGKWVSEVVVFAPNWANQSCSLCTHELSKGRLVSNYSSLYACDCETVHQAVPWLWCYFFSFLYLLKDPDLETAFHFKWELGICRITGHCLLLLSKVFYLGYVQELRASQSYLQNILMKYTVKQWIMPSYSSG